MKMMNITVSTLLFCGAMSTAMATEYGSNIAVQAITTATVVEGDAVTSVTDTSVETTQRTNRLGGTNIAETSRDAVQVIKGNYATVIDTATSRVYQDIGNH